MYTRIMWKFLRTLFKVTILVVFVGMIVIAAQMAYVGLFNFDDMWPFNLIFHWTRNAARVIFCSKIGKSRSCICTIHSGYVLTLLMWKERSIRWRRAPPRPNPQERATGKTNHDGDDHQEIRRRTPEGNRKSIRSHVPCLWRRGPPGQPRWGSRSPRTYISLPSHLSNGVYWVRCIWPRSRPVLQS